MSIPLKLIFILSLLCAPMVSSSYATSTKPKVSTDQLNVGYSAIRYFLEDEEHLTTIRIGKAILNFGGISEPSKKLVDDIAEASTKALNKLDVLQSKNPAIAIVELPDEIIGTAALDALRMTTAKEFLFDNDEFEKRLLISQAQVLRVISHLAMELAEQEPSKERKQWLQKLAKQYEDFYSLVYKRITLG